MLIHDVETDVTAAGLRALLPLSVIQLVVDAAVCQSEQLTLRQVFRRVEEDRSVRQDGVQVCLQIALSQLLLSGQNRCRQGFPDELQCVDHVLLQITLVVERLPLVGRGTRLAKLVELVHACLLGADLSLARLDDVVDGLDAVCIAEQCCEHDNTFRCWGKDM